MSLGGWRHFEWILRSRVRSRRFVGMYLAGRCEGLGDERSRIVEPFCVCMF